MEKINLLVIESQKEHLQTIIEILNNHEDWQKTIAANVEDTIEQFYQQDFDFLLLNDEVGIEEENKITRLINLQQPSIIIFRYGKLDIIFLENEILLAIEKQKENDRPVYSINDNVF